ncbi:MAG: ATP-binding protein, partial [Bacteroidota bacterium]
MTTPRIKLKDVLKQLKADAIGKDSHRGVTLTYSWLANQFGHFSLGFIPTILISPFILKYFNFENSALTSAYIVSLFWLLFESYNFLGP